MTMPDAKDGAEPTGAWAQSAKLAFRFLFLAVCLAAIGWSVSNFRQVPPESRAIVYRFGTIVRQQSSCLRKIARSSSASISSSRTPRSAAIS
jgi:hypothetical protein